MEETIESIDESIPIVTIHSPPDTQISASPTFLVHSTSLVHLSKNPIQLTMQTDDPKTISKYFSISTNDLNQTNSFSKCNLDSSHRFSQSEINLSQTKYSQDIDYDKLNSRLVDTLGFNGQDNHVDVTKQPRSPLVASLTSSDATPTDAKDKSLWDRLKSALCHPSKSEYRHRLDRLLYYLRVFLTHLFSTTGLCFLVVAYSCLGAVIFTHLESGHEMTVKASLESERIQTAHELWNFTMTLNVLHEKMWMQEVIRRIGQFEEKVVETMLTDGYGATVEQWNWPGALLYSVTVITTIGYGNVTCKTDWGRIATILYAIIGIPITFLCLANLGNLMAKAFRFSYRKICCCECFFSSKSTKLRKRASQRSASRKRRRGKKDFSEQSPIVQNAATMLLPPPPPTPPTASSLATTAFFDNASSNGTGSLPPASPGGRHHSIVVVSQPSGDCQQSRLGAIDLQRTHSLFTRSTSQGPPSPALTMVTVKSGNDQSTRTELVAKTSEFTDDESDIDDFDQEELDALEDEDRVPIYLVFLLVLGYIILGAFMFSIWEHWGIIESCYFCFATLSTIGFGDLVPGAAKLSQDKDGQTKFIICCVYMMVGLALIAMSFNLVQEEIVIKCRRIARRIGIMPTIQKQKKIKVLWRKNELENATII